MANHIYLVEYAFSVYVVAENDDKALEKANTIRADTLEEPRVNRITQKEGEKLASDGSIEEIEKNGWLLKYVGE